MDKPEETKINSIDEYLNSIRAINGDFDWIDRLNNQNDNNYLTENDRNLLNLFKNELKSIYHPVENRKFLKNKTKRAWKNCKLGQMIEYEIENASILSKPFKLENNELLVYIHKISIDRKKKYKIPNANNNSESGISLDESTYSMKKTNQIKTMGILAPSPLIDKLTFPIVGKTNELILEEVSICLIDRIKISKTFFENLLTFHHRLFSDLFPYQNVDEPNLNRLIDNSTNERKYIIAPIIKKDDIWELDKKIISNACKFNKKNYIGKSVIEIIKNNFLKIGNGSGVTEKIAKDRIKYSMKKNIFFTTYKYTLIEIYNILYPNDSFDIFLNKIITDDGYSEPTEFVEQQLKKKYFPTLTNDDYKTIKTRDILEIIPTEAISINGFRKIASKNNIKLNAKTTGYAYGTPLKYIKHYDYSYNKTFSLNLTKSNKNNGLSMKNIFPVEYIQKYFINKKIFNLCTKLPSILMKLERILVPIDLCNNFDINLTVSDSENQVPVYKRLEKILFATTSPAIMEEYNFETLETLGDTIIKFILSINLILMYPNESEGVLESKRKKLLKNEKLQEVALNTKLYTYLLNQPLKISDWEPPFKRPTPFTNSKHQSCTKKCAADVLEAFVGACYLLNNNLEESHKIMIKMLLLGEDKTIDNDKQTDIIREKITLTRIIFSLSPDLEYEISFMDLFLYNKLNKLFCEMPCTISLFLDDGKTYNQDSINILEERIRYKFINKTLLVTAFTHQSYNKEISKNYQRLELLGDSVLELYLILRLFDYFEEKFFKNNKFDSLNLKLESSELDLKSFSCGNLSHAKSLLASNNFMIKITVMIGLQQFLIINDRHSMDNLFKYFNEDNIKITLNQKINEYENDPLNCVKPKIISDLFESLLGAILIDSNLDNCFKFLDNYYTPFIQYIALYFDKIKYSPVSEFIELGSKLFGKMPRFSRAQNPNDNQCKVDAWIGEKLIASGSAVSEQRAKDIAAIEGIKLIKHNLIEI